MPIYQLIDFVWRSGTDTHRDDNSDFTDQCAYKLYNYREESKVLKFLSFGIMSLVHECVKDLRIFIDY